MLDRTPTGRRRNRIHYVAHDPREVKTLTKIMQAHKRLSESAHVVGAGEAGVVVLYDATAFDELASLLARLEDDEDGHDLEYSTGGRECIRIAGKLIEVDDAEHDGSEHDEDGEETIGWTEGEARWGKYAWHADEPTLGSLDCRVDQTLWAASGTTDEEHDDADDPRGEDVNEDGDGMGNTDSGLCGFLPFDGEDQTKGFKSVSPDQLPPDFLFGRPRGVRAP